jgi:hypothetical protein
MKSKKTAIHAELRKESKSFDGWLKYEVTIKNEDGSIEKVPAYGKDLQDALSRVVHDSKVEKVLPIVNKVPNVVWVLLWFTIIGTTTTLLLNVQGFLGQWAGFAFLGVIGITTAITLSISNYLSLKNIPK